MMGTPVSAGYSVLGWNHPGFSGSTGRPYPDQEVAAADAVMQMAIHKLGFQPEDIIVYGWSIGGFTASWLAMTYPSVRGLILDATFDRLEPLAVPRMPAAMAGLVSRAVTSFVRLDVAAQTVAFPGPLRLIRRNRDEMISTVEGEMWSNRGNALLEVVLRARHPSLASPDGLAGLHAMLYSPGALSTAGSQEAEAAYLALEEAEAEEAGAGAVLPGDQQALILGYLASKLMTEVGSMQRPYCTALCFRWTRLTARRSPPPSSWSPGGLTPDPHRSAHGPI
jgi:pimeloyl-ACP methyl ester carboxylesterase